jgi:hypothetical protein
MRRPNLVVVIGIWVLCLPSCVLSALIMVEMLSYYRDREHFVFFWLMAVTVFVTAFMLYRITKNFITIPPRKEIEEAVITDDFS